MEPVIFHIDVNSAFLSWSALKRLQAGDPVDLRTIPSIIGGDSSKRHGVVLAKSIPAKKFHIVTGEPIAQAFRKCPFLVTEAPDMGYYRSRSHELMEFLSGICPDIEQVSVDECYMDFSPIANRYASPVEAAMQIKDAVRKRFGYTVNIGISDRKVLAKMASDFEKPDRVHTLFQKEIQKKMWPLPVSSLYMCGHSSVETLKKLEILTIGDLAKADPEILSAHLKRHGILLWEYANGIDSSRVEVLSREQKGIGNSITLPADALTREDAFHSLLSLSDSVGKRLRAAGLLAGSIHIELKYNTFDTVSRQTILDTPTDLADQIYQTACSLFDQLWDQTPIRLLGVRTGKLQSKAEPLQLDLFSIQAKKEHEPSSEKQQKLNAALDSIRARYGDSAVTRGCFLPPGKK